ncbi:hypothetical protein [Spirochaeta cellobiosiphila]|uniref:hypothetical protein n=1 Tax=Spirochaeta cellobiosiphila TaxID=504483 RepID=UPI0004913284|nr:hypothetical protein [Spirochaeta cellobiosiphila]
MKYNRIIYPIILWTWCLPQSLLGFFIFLLIRIFDRKSYHYPYLRSTRMVRTNALGGGLALGCFIFSYDYERAGKNPFTIQTQLDRHEWGHFRQNLRLGPAYLLVVGIPSFFWAVLYRIAHSRLKSSYYSHYPEEWADKLGKVER